MSSLTAASRREALIASRLRSLCVEVIERTGEAQAAHMLGLAPTGLRALLWRQEWSLETWVRVADALDLPIIQAWVGSDQPAASQAVHASGA